MKIMKLFASCAMVGALTAVCASGAFAAASADVCSDYTADEGATTGYVTVTAGDAYSAAGDYTVLVYPAQVVVDDETVNLDEVATISDSYIKQIDQNSTGTFTLKFDGLADGEYYVRLGGAESGYVYDTFTVGEQDDPEQVYIGDADGNGTIAAADLSEIAKDLAEFNSSLKNNEVNRAAAAYCTGDDTVTAADLSEIAKFLAEFETPYVNKTVALGTYPIAE